MRVRVLIITTLRPHTHKQIIHILPSKRVHRHHIFGLPYDHTKLECLCWWERNVVCGEGAGLAGGHDVHQAFQRALYIRMCVCVCVRVYGCVCERPGGMSELRDGCK